MILLDVVIASLLVVTSVYCWRLNRKMASFRNARHELDHMLKSFDASIRQAYESVAFLKDAGSTKNLQIIREMDKVRYLANDLAFLVERGEKIADSLENSIRQNQAQPQRAAAPQPQSQPQPRRAQPQSQQAITYIQPRAVSPMMAALPEPEVDEDLEITQAIAYLREVPQISPMDPLARSYVSEPVTKIQPAYRPTPAQQARQVEAQQAAATISQPVPRQQAALRQQQQQAPRTERPKAPPATQNRTNAIEKLLNHLAAKNTQNPAAMPSVPPKEITRKAELQPEPVQPARQKRFFDTLRVITPNE